MGSQEPITSYTLSVTRIKKVPLDYYTHGGNTLLMNTNNLIALSV